MRRLLPLRLALAACAVLALEGLARVLAIRVPPALYAADQNEAWWRLNWLYHDARDGSPALPGFFVFDAELGWAPRKGLDSYGVGRGRRASTNALGARGKAEIPYARRKGRQRLLVLGDSFAFGEGVGDDETFAAGLARRLPGVDVVNVGVGGYGHDQMLLYYRREGRRYGADAVLLAYIDEDRRRDDLSLRDHAKPWFDLVDGRLVLRGVPVPGPDALRRRLQGGSRLLDFARCLLDRVRRPPEPSPRAEALLDALRAEAAADGARFGLFSASRPPPGALAAYCGGRGLECPVVDLARFPDHAGHWTAAEHAEAARALEPYVRGLLRAH